MRSNSSRLNARNVALLVTAFGTTFLIADPGSVYIHFRGYVIEMTVPVLAAKKARFSAA